ALYPPEVAPEDALRPPLGYPTWRFYIDGRWLYIANEVDYLRLAPGHSGRPDGPWPQDVPITVSWIVGQGPYAPVPGWTPARSALYPVGPAAAMVYATRPLVYAGWGRSCGEIFRLLERLTDEELRATEQVRPVRGYGDYARHDWTG